MALKSRASKVVLKKNEKRKGDRANWEEHWRELAIYNIPRKDEINTKTTPGQKKNQQLLDNTSMEACESLAGGLHGFLTNPFAQWFELTTGDDDLDSITRVRVWLQKTQKTLLQILNNSNFQTEVHELYLDLSCFGTSVMSIEEDDEEVIRFSTKHIDDVFLEEDNKGRIRELDIVFEWDIDKIESEYGEEVFKKSEALKQAKADSALSDKKFEIVQSIYVNGDKGDDMKFISHHVLKADETDLRVKGFRDFPFVTPRWVKGANETYGRSAAMKALPDAKTLNSMTDSTLRSAQLSVRPPLQVPDDGFLIGAGRGVKTRPGSINYYRAGTKDRIEPIQTGGRVDFGIELIRLTQEKIKQAFFTDQLRLIQGGPQMTATEVLQRVEDAMRLLGPMLGRQQSEFLRPLIERVFEVALRQGKIKLEEIPEELEGRRLDVNYSSLIAKAQRSSEVRAILETVQTVAPFIELDEQVADNFDGDKAVRTIAKLTSFPQEILRSREDIEGMRDERQKAQEAELLRQAEADGVENASKLAPGVAQLASIPSGQ